MTDDTTDDGNESTDPEEIQTLDELKEKARAAQNKRKEYTFEFPDGSEVTLEYRMLREEEEDAIREKATREYRGRTGDMQVEVDSKQVKLGVIKRGVTDGPEGWSESEREIEQATTPDMREELSNAIEKFSQMNDEERTKFR